MAAKTAPPVAAQRLIAGAFVAFVLIVASDNETTAPIAVSFAYLILITTALVVGPSALQNVSALVSAPSSGRARGGSY